MLLRVDIPTPDCDPVIDIDSELNRLAEEHAAEGVVVGLRARRTLRVDLEVRAFDAAGRTESWVYSLKAAPGSNATAVPWSRFRSLSGADLREEESAQPEHPEAADLRRVNGLFFIVTPTTLAPGSSAALQLEVLGLYGGR